MQAARVQKSDEQDFDSVPLYAGGVLVSVVTRVVHFAVYAALAATIIGLIVVGVRQ